MPKKKKEEDTSAASGSASGAASGAAGADADSMLSDLFGGLELMDAADAKVARQLPNRGMKAAAIGMAFVDGLGNRFVAPNTLIAFNPDDHIQVAHVEEHMKKMTDKADEMKVPYSVVKFHNENAGVILTKVGGASPRYISKKFPPTSAYDWFSPPKPPGPKGPRAQFLDDSD
jgi:hypothetical protein